MATEKITLIEFENGDTSIDFENSHSPFSKIKKEWTQEIEIDETKWRRAG
jgi:hypothetical protein